MVNIRSNPLMRVLPRRYPLESTNVTSSAKSYFIGSGGTLRYLSAHTPAL